MLSERQEKILNLLIKEYIDIAEPISSNLLQKKYRFDISPATIRNELQELTQQGYIIQPHTSAGRIPTNKGYHYFIEITFSQSTEKLPSFIEKEIEIAKQKIENELRLAQELTKSLQQIHSALHLNRIEEDNLFDILKIIGTPQTTYDRNIESMKQLLEKFTQLNNF